MSRALPLRSTFDGTPLEHVGFRRLYNRHFGVVWAVVSAMGVATAHRDDVMQETWALAYRKRHRLRADASERAWLAALARGVALRHRRAEGRRTRKHLALAANQVRARPPQECCDAKRTAQSVLASLNPDQRIAYVLVHAHGFSATEVAHATQSSPNTVYSRLRLARRSVQRAAHDARLEDEAIARRLSREGEHARGRVWAGLAASLPAAAVSPATSALGVLAAAMTLAWGGWTAAHLESPGTTEQRAGITASRAAGARRPHAASPVNDAGVLAQSPASPPTTMAPSYRADQVTSPRRSALDRRTSAPVSAAVHKKSKRTRDSADTTESATDADVRLLARARATIRNGDPGGALALLTAHARHFHDSPLADIRDATTIAARCLVGDTEGARTLARRFGATHPTSSARQAVQQSCGGSDGFGGRPDVAAP